MSAGTAANVSTTTSFLYLPYSSRTFLLALSRAASEKYLASSLTGGGYTAAAAPGRASTTAVASSTQAQRRMAGRLLGKRFVAATIPGEVSVLLSRGRAPRNSPASAPARGFGCLQGECRAAPALHDDPGRAPQGRRRRRRRRAGDAGQRRA